MALVDVENPARVVHLRGELAQKYKWLVARLGPRYQPIEDAINGMIDGHEVRTAGWLPGSDWTGTPFEAIYEVCGRNQEEAGLSFGLIVWMVFEKRPETWASAHGMKDGREIRSRTYFRWPPSQ